MLSYYLSYYSSTVVVRDEANNNILKVVQNSKWFAKSIYKFYVRDNLILKCSYSSSLFSKSIKIEYSGFDEIIEFKRVNKKYFLHYQQNYYSVKKVNLFAKSKPMFKILKNDVEVGEVFCLKRVFFGGGLLYRIDFYIEDNANLFQIILFILQDQQSLIA